MHRYKIALSSLNTIGVSFVNRLPLIVASAAVNHIMSVSGCSYHHRRSR